LLRVLGYPNIIAVSTENPSRGVLSLKQQTYIEVIGEMEQRHGHAHVTELARELGVSKPSVVQMVRRLTEAGVVRRAREITLSETGRRVVKEFGDRQTLLQDFMIRDLGMDRKSASEDACRLEHIVSTAFMRSLRRFRNGMDDQGK